jgi:hypothetical protein
LVEPIGQPSRLKLLPYSSKYFEMNIDKDKDPAGILFGPLLLRDVGKKHLHQCILLESNVLTANI